jgi:transcription factor C subunit 6
MAGSLRRSHRERKQNPKYATDTLGNPESENDDNFQPPEVEDEGDEEFEETINHDDPMEDIAENELSDELQSQAEDDNDAGSPVLKKSKSQAHVSGTHSRGLKPSQHHVSNSVTTSEFAGNDPEHWTMLRHERLKWVNHVTLPTRRMSSDRTGGLDYPKIYQKVREKEELNFMEWYVSAAPVLAKMQRTTVLSTSAGQDYVPLVKFAQEIHMGPYGNQNSFQLAPKQFLSVQAAWRIATENTSHTESEDATNRSGWVINMGTRVVTMEWAPNQFGDTQYLAVVVAIDPPIDHPRVSAFSPTKPYKAGIQIWAIKSIDDNGMNLIDEEQSPELVHVICTEWGSARRISWCNFANLTGKVSTTLGLLATVWSDGCIRLLDISLHNSSVYGMFSNTIL